jgi:hypothetical protein
MAKKKNKPKPAAAGRGKPVSKPTATSKQAKSAKTNRSSPAKIKPSVSAKVTPVVAKVKAKKPDKTAKDTRPAKVGQPAKASKPTKPPGGATPKGPAAIQPAKGPGGKPSPKGPAEKVAKSVAVAAAKPEAAAKGDDKKAEIAKTRSTKEKPAEFSIPEPEEVILTDAEGRPYCRVNECDQYAVVEGYCRYHYLFFWKRIQTRKKILSEGKLVRYIEELTGRYPDKYLEILLKDLRSQKDFLAVIQELELDDSGSEEAEFAEDDSQTYIDEVRGSETEATTTTEEDY